MHATSSPFDHSRALESSLQLLSVFGGADHLCDLCAIMSLMVTIACPVMRMMSLCESHFLFFHSLSISETIQDCNELEMNLRNNNEFEKNSETFF